MAEERICIYKETRPQENVYEHYEFDKRHLTRQEAIEKMAKAICANTGTGCTNCYCEDSEEDCAEFLREVKKFRRLAAAALNALLEN